MNTLFCRHRHHHTHAVDQNEKMHELKGMLCRSYNYLEG